MHSNVLSDGEHSEYRSITGTLMYLAVMRRTNPCMAADMLNANAKCLKNCI